MDSNNSELMNMKNLGMASVNILHAIGINTYDELSTMGAVDAYCKIKSRGIHVSKVMLYALEGALLNVHWNDLSEERKQQLVEQAEKKENALTAVR